MALRQSLKRPLERLKCSPLCRLFGTTPGEQIDVYNPATGAKITSIPADSPEVVRLKFEKAAEGQRRWRSTDLAQRKAALLRFGELLHANADSLAGTMTAEMGKPIAQARNEIQATAPRIRYFAENAHLALEPRTVLETPKTVERVVYEPLGVVANISAWNYPYFVSANVFGAALATGNSVLFKPSEFASLSGLAMAALLYEAGIPEDAFVVTMGGGATGAAVAALEGLGGVFFTGSNRTGVAVARLAAPNLVKVQLELGGKDPIYVRADVPRVGAAAAAIADGAFYNAGQSCCSVERVYVDKKIIPQFLEDFAATVRSYKVGDPSQEGTYLGPLTRRPQLRVLKDQVDDAVARGAKLAVGGDYAALEEQPGNFFPPTVLADVDHSMSVMREESFGPIIGIQAVDGDEEALSLMADTSYGLTAGVYCRHPQDAERILTELDVGSGYWNCCDRSVPRLPWSGRKGSGLGCTLSLDGLQAFVRPKAFHFQKQWSTASVL